MTSRLRISAHHLDAIHRHAAAAYPEECCGILVGDGRTVERVLRSRNTRRDRPRDRFEIEPRALLKAHREAREVGLDVVGYYHSHPDHPAEPSAVDREHAWPGVSNVIVSVRDGEVHGIRSWRLTDDRRRFVEETITDPPRKGCGRNKA